MADFMECDDTTWSDKFDSPADKRHSVRLMDENITANHQVETGIINKILDRRRLENSLRIPCCPLLRHHDGFGAPVYADHRAVRPDHLACKHRDVAGTAADIENTHARRNAGFA